MDRAPHKTSSLRARVLCASLLVAVVLSAELTLGKAKEAEHASQLRSANEEHWSLRRFKAPPGSIDPLPRADGVRRFVYLSNSHARTGGQVSRHLQDLLDRAAPEKFELLDMSDPGIFAPDMLQRFVASLDYAPDALILPVAYISFSDRMKLSRQSITARSFFRPEVFTRLSPFFWLRNFDVTLYGEMLISRFSSLYRYRSGVRDLWEIPLANMLRQRKGEKIRFLEVDENRSWQFPDGFDSNLFDWSLYSLGRRGHLGDMRELVATAAKHSVPLWAFNLPVDWKKEPHQADRDDVNRYRGELRELFRDARSYTDYQGAFPADFTTYDALHPTWHGARLHAFDIALRLSESGFLGSQISSAALLAHLNASETAVSVDYLTNLNGNYPPLADTQLRRFDPSEPANARELLRRLASLEVGSATEHRFLEQLSLRIRYWLEGRFTAGEKRPNFSHEWYKGLSAEIEKARERMRHFRSALVAFEETRLSQFPIPKLDTLSKGEERQIAQLTGPTGRILLFAERIQLPNRVTVDRIFESARGRDVAILVPGSGERKGYMRVDLLGDGSFILLRETKDLYVPAWVYSDAVGAEWGV